MEWIKLIGVVIIVVGFVLKFDTIATVLVAGVVTGVVGGLGILDILRILGESFVSKRYMSLFLLTLLVIGVLERYGLRERAAYLINKLKSATAGSVLSTYTVIRLIMGAFSLRLGGHVQFIRPLINPMATGASVNKYGTLKEKSVETLKGYSAAAENYGNFFGQNVFIASSGVLLIVATLEELGIVVTAADVSSWSLPIAFSAGVLAIVQNHFMDRRIDVIQKSNQMGREQ